MNPTEKRSATSSGSEAGRDSAAAVLRIQGEQLLLLVKLKPRSSRRRIEGVTEGRLVVAVNAPAAGGKANQALIELLSETIFRPKSSFRIVRGETARQKTLSITGITAGELAARLGIPVPEGG